MVWLIQYLIMRCINEHCNVSNTTHFVQSFRRIYCSEMLTLCCFVVFLAQVKVKQSHYMPWQSLRVPAGWGSKISKQSTYEDGKVVSHTYRPPLHHRKYCWYAFLFEVELTHGAAGRITSIKNSSAIRNRPRDFPACSAVPQPSAPPYIFLAKRNVN